MDVLYRTLQRLGIIFNIPHLEQTTERAADSTPIGQINGAFR